MLLFSIVKLVEAVFACETLSSLIFPLINDSYHCLTSTMSARRQKGLTGYCFKYCNDRQICVCSLTKRRLRAH